MQQRSTCRNRRLAAISGRSIWLQRSPIFASGVWPDHSTWSFREQATATPVQMSRQVSQSQRNEQAQQINQPPRQIGPYRIIGELGRGGMAAVLSGSGQPHGAIRSRSRFCRRTWPTTSAICSASSARGTAWHSCNTPTSCVSSRPASRWLSLPVDAIRRWADAGRSAPRDRRSLLPAQPRSSRSSTRWPMRLTTPTGWASCTAISKTATS